MSVKSLSVRVFVLAAFLWLVGCNTPVFENKTLTPPNGETELVITVYGVESTTVLKVCGEIDETPKCVEMVPGGDDGIYWETISEDQPEFADLRYTAGDLTALRMSLHQSHKENLENP